MFDLFVDFVETKNKDVVQIQKNRLKSNGGDGIMQVLEVMATTHSHYAKSWFLCLHI
jgi:hypothetical protein